MSMCMLDKTYLDKFRRFRSTQTCI